MAAKINPNERATVSNLCNWDLHFRGIENDRDMKIPANATNLKTLTIGEVDSQVKTGNVFFCGTDGMGKNASVKIEDESVRKFVFGIPSTETPEKQIILDLETVKDLLKTSPKAAFEKKLNELVVTEAEKRMIIPLAKQAGISDVESYKASMIEKISGSKFSTE